MSTTPEGKVRNPVVKWAEQNGFLHFRMSFRIGVKQGVPDDLFIAPGGIHCWVEFKAPRKEPTPLQMHRIEALLDRSVAAFWCDDSAEGIAALNRILQFTKLATAPETGPAN